MAEREIYEQGFGSEKGSGSIPEVRVHGKVGVAPWVALFHARGVSNDIIPADTVIPSRMVREYVDLPSGSRISERRQYRRANGPGNANARYLVRCQLGVDQIRQIPRQRRSAQKTAMRIVVQSRGGS